MQEVVLGRTALRVSRLGLGTAPLASIFWGNDETTAGETARRALDAGVTFFDTAPFYGLGESESRLGAAVRGARDGVVIATKVGRLLDAGPDGQVEARFDFSYDAVQQSIDSSLGRLGTDRIDVVHIHDPDDHIDEAVAGAYRALVDLRDQGVIHAVSLGTNSVGDGGDLPRAVRPRLRVDRRPVHVAGPVRGAGAPTVCRAGDRVPGRRRVQQRRPGPADRGRLVRLRARCPVRCSIGRSRSSRSAVVTTSPCGRRR